MNGAMTRDPSLKERLEGLESEALSRSLWADGFARISGLMAAEQCASLIAAYDDDALYRTTVVMARHGFGRGICVWLNEQRYLYRRVEYYRVESDARGGKRLE